MRIAVLTMAASVLISCAGAEREPVQRADGSRPLAAGHGRVVSSDRSDQPRRARRAGPSVGLTARGTYVFGGDVDGAEDGVDAAMTALEARVAFAAWRRARIELRARYEYRRYEFGSDAAGTLLGGTGDDELNLQTADLSGSLIQSLGEGWVGFLRTGVRGSAELGADLEDGVSWRLFAGAGRQVTERLVLGAGVGVLGRLEESVLVIPALQVQWRFADAWNLAVEGPGATLSWRIADDWGLELSARWESRRYRLDAGGLTARGIFEDQRVPVTVTVHHRLDDSWSIAASIGFDAYRRLELEDRRGADDVDRDVDPGVFFGLEVGATF